MIAEDKELVTSFFELEEQTNVDRMSPWLLRIELNREMMVDKKLTMSQVAEKITTEFGDELHCIFSDDNAENLILRVGIWSAALRAVGLQTFNPQLHSDDPVVMTGRTDVCCRSAS